MRNITEILHFREDISPFLVHLTKSYDDKSAADNLTSILTSMELRCGATLVSDARFGIDVRDLTGEERQRFFCAIAFTETPLNEIHCLLEIGGRAVNLEPYGVVLLKDAAMRRGVSPVLYLNNFQRDKDAVLRALCSLIEASPKDAEQILPLVAIFGEKAQGGITVPVGQIDFRWEREWRYVSAKGPYHLVNEEIFMGLCPHDEIDQFEANFPPLGFIDPRRNMKWYADKLIAARQRCDLKYSVV